jgi:hypothetical protein
MFHKFKTCDDTPGVSTAFASPRDCGVNVWQNHFQYPRCTVQPCHSKTKFGMNLSDSRHCGNTWGEGRDDGHALMTSKHRGAAAQLMPTKFVGALCLPAKPHELLSHRCTVQRSHVTRSKIRYDVV